MGMITYEHSVDSGRTWAPFIPQHGAAIVVELRRLREYEIFDDGLGNLYRWKLSGT